jgi:O-methyltransferase involved in polyketide biosynthesis
MMQNTQPPPQRESQNLAYTALYTCGVWYDFKLPYAEIFVNGWVKATYFIVNVVRSCASLFRPDFEDLPRSLLFRHRVIDELVAANLGAQIIELASGLSSRGLRFVHAHPAIRYTEIDMPLVQSWKRQLIEGAKAEAKNAIVKQPRMLECDLLQEEWNDFVADPSSAALIIAEGLAMYLNDEERKRFFSRCAALATEVPGAMLVFDFVPPREQGRPGVIGGLFEMLFKWVTAGRTMEAIKLTREELKQELMGAGFERVEFIEPAPAAGAKLRMLLFVAMRGVLSDFDCSGAADAVLHQAKLN